MTTLDQIKSMMKSGDIAGAEALCKQALEADPANAELKMRYGLCRQLLGDEETFRRIHDELAPEMEREAPLREGGAPKGRGENAAPPSLPSACAPETLSLWRKYHKLWLSLIVGALVIGGAAAGVLVFGEEIRAQFEIMVRATQNPLYAAPKNPEFETRVVNPGYDLYAGPKYDERAIHGESLSTGE